MDEATRLASAVDSKDPRVGLRAVAARTHGWSWQEIAAELGVSRQAVHKKHAARRGLLRRD
jgi:DNA-directed RNA polymerase specialized sigma24 family protein